MMRSVEEKIQGRQCVEGERKKGNEDEIVEIVDVGVFDFGKWRWD